MMEVATQAMMGFRKGQTYHDLLDLFEVQLKGAVQNISSYKTNDGVVQSIDIMLHDNSKIRLTKFIGNNKKIGLHLKKVG
jgi:phosphoenolpyruvate synthase/pyruvate phosphate dikinase